VIVYPGRSSKRGDVQHHSGRIVDYLVNSRGLDQRRIVTLVGPVRDELFVELWITPQGATPPNP
jgi:recombinational DNA repair ATPase RecF